MKFVKLAAGLSSAQQCENSRSSPQKVGNTNQRDVRSRAKRALFLTLTLALTLALLTLSLSLFVSPALFPSLALLLSKLMRRIRNYVDASKCAMKLKCHNMKCWSRVAHTYTHTHTHSYTCMFCLVRSHLK